MNNKIIKTYEGKQIVYDADKKTWDYDGLSEDIYTKANPELEKKINAFLASSVKEYNERMVEEEKKKYWLKHTMRIAKHQEFKNEVEKNDLTGFNVSYEFDSKTGKGRVNMVEIKKNNVCAEIYNEPTIHSGWGRAPTNKAWVTEINYKRIRYKDLDKAIKKVMERINDKITSVDYGKKLRYERELRNGELTKVFNEIDCVFEDRERYSSVSKRCTQHQEM